MLMEYGDYACPYCGVNGTPTFFIHGIRHDAAYHLETLLAAIKAAMNA